MKRSARKLWLVILSALALAVSAIGSVSAPIAQAAPASAPLAANAHAWFPETLPAFFTGSLTDVSCYSTLNCVAVGNGDQVLRWTGFDWWVEFLPGAYSLYDVDCAAGVCRAVGSGGAILSDSGGSWHTETSVTVQPLYGVSCSSPTACKAVGRAGLILSWNGSVWHNESSPSLTLNDLTSVSCVGSECYAVGISGTILHWYQFFGWSATIVGSTNFNGVSCNQFGACKIAGAGGTILSWPGGADTSGTTNDLYDVACPSDTSCKAGGVNGTLLSGTWNGTNWTWSPDTLIPGTTVPVRSLSCPSETMCKAVVGSVLRGMNVNANALNFDGVDDYVALNRPVQDDFTIEFWLKTTQSSAYGSYWWQGIGLVDGEAPGVTDDFGIALADGMVQFGVGNPDTTIESGLAKVNDGAWHHVAATRQQSSGAMQLYVDGTLIASGTGQTGSLTAPAQLRIGSLQVGSNYFQGTIDEVRFWNTVRTQAQIRANINSEISAQAGLVTYYQFNQGIAAGDNQFVTTAVDDSVSANNGTLNNFSLGHPSASPTSNWVSGGAPWCSAITLVTGNADSGAGTLRNAIANACVEGTVAFSGDRAITLASELVIAKDLTIDGTSRVVTVSGNDATRVVHAIAPLTINSLTIQNGNATGNGGGLWASQPVTLTNVSFLTNTASGVGGGLVANNTAVLNNVTFDSNTAGSGGGGMDSEGDTTIGNSTFTNNLADNGAGYGTGGGLQIGGGTASLTNVTFDGNQANGGSDDGGGAIMVYDGSLSLDRVTLTRNHTAGTGGGGISIFSGTTGQVDVVNSLFAGNTADTGNGDAISLRTNKPLNVTFTTVANPALVGGSAIDVSAGTATVLDTIITNHAVGLNQTGGTVSEDFNLFYGNTTDLNGTIASGGNDQSGDPFFVDPANDDYHIGPESPAVNNGTDAGIAVDVDGDARPQGTDYDIGYDEVKQNCSLSTGTDYDLATSAVTLSFSDMGGVQCVAAVYFPRAHPGATGTIGHGVGGDHFWSITARDVDGLITTGFNASLTAPFDNGLTSPTLCFYPGGVGGNGWNCGGTDNGNGTITWSGLTRFSDWAVGNNVGPTAVTLKDLSAASQPIEQPDSSALPIIALLVLGLGSWWFTRRVLKFR